MVIIGSIVDGNAQPDRAALQLISEENRKDDFGFARRYGQRGFTFTLLNTETGIEDEVFWPAVPITVEVLINSGARNSAARWADSGEGDQLLAHRHEPTSVPNRLPTAAKGRAEAFIQKRHIPSEGYVPTMHFPIDKIKSEHDLLWCPLISRNSTGECLTCSANTILSSARCRQSIPTLRSDAKTLR